MILLKNISLILSIHSVDLLTDVFLTANWKRFKSENILVQERGGNGEFKN